MRGQSKTKEQLINELKELRYRTIEQGQLEDKREQTEEALWESDNYYRTLVQNLPQKIFLKDRNSVYLSCNENYSRDLNITPAEITGKTDYDFYPKELAEKYQADDKNIMESGKTEEIEEGYIQDGKEIIVHTVKTPIKDEKGKIIGILGIFWDITKSKRAEDDLRKYREQLEELVEKRTAELRMANKQLEREIVERRQIEETLREYQKAIESSKDMISVIDQNYNYLLANNAFLKSRGMDREQVVGRPVPEVLGKDVFESVVKKNLDACLQGEVIQFEMQYTYPELGKRDLLVSYFPAEGSGGTKRVVSVIRDITGRKRAEEALRRSEEAMKHLAQENAIIAEIGRIINSTLNIEEVYQLFAEEIRKLIPFEKVSVHIINPAKDTYTVAYTVGVDIEGRRSGDDFPLKGSLTEEVMCLRSSFLAQAENIEELKNRYPGSVAALQAGLRSTMSVPIFLKDKVIGGLHIGLLKPNAYTETDMRLAERVSNQIAGAIANAQLLTEIKQAEESLRREREIFFTTLSNAPGGILLLSPDDRRLYVNPEFTNITGYTPQDISMVTDWFNKAFSGSKYKEKAIENWKNDRLRGKTIDRESNIICKDGKIKRLEIRAIFLKDNKAVVAFYDVSERKRAEEENAALQEQLRQSQKMEAIGRLAGGIAHDFNNILTVIKGYSQLSFIEMTEDNPLRENIEEIKKSTERAADLTRQLLAFSRRQILDMKVLDLNDILRDLDKMLRRIIGEDIELVTLLAENLGTVKTDSGQIEQVIMNLAVNARDAMPKGGKLTIETANVILDQEYARKHVAVKPGHYTMLSVSDTGCGMTSEVRDKVFEPFFTTKEKGKGTGLGLSTVYGIVKQSGGNIWVYSEPGLGTTFKIYLPRVDEPIEEVAEQAAIDETPRGNETILIVEDDETVRKLAVRILEKQGYTVSEAKQGDEALKVCQQQKEPFHLILVDVVMPNMSGNHLVDSLKQVCRNIKVLYMSGYTDDTIVQHGILEKGVDFIQKPFTVDGLARKVREVLDKSSKPTT